MAAIDDDDNEDDYEDRVPSKPLGIITSEEEGANGDVNGRRGRGSGE